MLINRAYVFRLYPTEEQKVFINKCIGCSRFVYNYYLNKKEWMYKNKLKKCKYGSDYRKLVSGG